MQSVWALIAYNDVFKSKPRPHGLQNVYLIYKTQKMQSVCDLKAYKDVF